MNIRPTVEAADDAVDGEKQVVIWLLESLSDGIELTLVRARVVGLCFAGHRSNKVRVDSEGKAYHIDCFLDVAFPVSTLFGVVNLVDDDIVLLVSVGIDVEGREPNLARVFCAREEVEDALLLGDDAGLLF